MLKAIREAIQANKESEVKKLLQESKNLVNAGDEFGKPLHTAAFYGRYSIVKVLLEGGADVEAANKRNSTAMHFAAGKDQAQVVETLIKAGADINHQDNIGFTPLHSAAYTGGIKTVKLLSALPDCDLTLVSAYGKTALEVAKEEKKFEVVNYLSKLNDKQPKDPYLEGRVEELSRALHQMKSKTAYDTSPSNTGLLTDKILRRIASKIGNEQTDLGIELDLELPLVKQIQRDNRDSTRDATLTILTTWRDKNSKLSDQEKVNKLQTALNEIERQDLVSYLKELLKS